MADERAELGNTVSKYFHSELVPLKFIKVDSHMIIVLVFAVKAFLYIYVKINF
jgi:hypothetical protein